jgi:hypothetical protein
LGQEAVQVVGRKGKIVHRVAIGTGAITPFRTFVQRFQVDLAKGTDDGVSYWRDGTLAIDMDTAMIIVNHPISEEAGIINLARHLERQFPEVPFHHIPQRCLYELVGG